MRGSLVFILLIVAAHADADERDLDKHVRTTDGYVREMVREAIRTCPSFCTLVARLVRSDVVVYLTRSAAMPPDVDAHMSFVSTAGGIRYVAVRVFWALSPRRFVSIIAHELQHAVEITDAPWVVDEETLARECEKMGTDNPRQDGAVRMFDSGAAILAGERAWLEYGSSQLPPPKPPTPKRLGIAELGVGN